MGDEFHFDIAGDDQRRRRLMGYDEGPDWHTYVAALDYVRSRANDGGWFATLNRQLNNGIDLTDRQIDNVIATMAADGIEQLGDAGSQDA